MSEDKPRRAPTLRKKPAKDQRITEEDLENEGADHAAVPAAETAALGIRQRVMKPATGRGPARTVRRVPDGGLSMSTE